MLFACRKVFLSEWRAPTISHIMLDGKIIPYSLSAAMGDYLTIVDRQTNKEPSVSFELRSITLAALSHPFEAFHNIVLLLITEIFHPAMILPLSLDYHLDRLNLEEFNVTS